MKKVLFLFSFIGMFSMLHAQDNVTLSLTESSQIWSVVETALSQAGVAIGTFNESSGVLQSKAFEYTALMVKNRAKYEIKLSGSTVSVELVNREYMSQNGWASNPLPVSKQLKAKYVASLLSKIETLSKDATKITTATKASQLHPVFKSSETINGLSVSISSTRVIGNKIMISGKLVTSKNMPIRSMGDLKLISKEGTIYSTNNGSFAGEETAYMQQINQNMEADIPVSYNVLFDVNSDPIASIKKFSTKFYSPTDTQFAFYDVPVPIAVDPNLNESTIEIYKDVYLTFKKQDDSNGHLKIYFMVENKSRTTRRLQLVNLSVIDSNGTKFDDWKLFVGGEDARYKNVSVEPGIPLAGIFDFTGNIPFESLMVLKFSTHQYADFSIKKIVFKP